ncbi:ABC transporter ATP-binding protein/permease [Cellulophaga baltica]|uniref:ABC transporter ATP-binding protein n=1 Tax=Cellulophaga TaxID=104264 RepID=UPI001C079126|nr:MULTISPECIES: ABC transporter ATP-binding protein [Cellulophaga]MBU2995797.1 ABC transporter ATP-binding protein/permease [Cellulophaga baltica]MDO6767192.1 ABC transporter ATP-binding protein [Cellulophaga sp. 1_MG-2023]
MNKLIIFFKEFFIEDIFIFFRKKKIFFVLGIIFLFLSGIIQLMIPLSFGDSLGSMTNSDKLVYPKISSFVFVFSMVLFQFVLMFAKDYFFMRFSLEGISNLKRHLFDKFLKLPMAYHNKSSVGGIISILTHDVETVKTLYSSNLSKFFYDIFIVFVATIILLSINYKLSLILLSIFGLSISVAYLFGKKIRRIALKTQNLNFKLSSKFEESLHRIQTIKIFTSEESEVAQASKKINGVFNEMKKNEILESILYLVGLLMIMSSLLFMVWYASYMLTTGEIVIEDTVPIIINLLFIIYSISGIAKFLANLERARGTTLRLVDVLNDDPEAYCYQGILKENFTDSISIKNAGLYYENSKNMVLKDLSFTIGKGEKVAIVGSNGSGKSSLINLILRLYEPTKGSIYLDRQNIKQINLQSYRNLFSVVSQDISLFNMSVDDNICYPDKNIDKEKISYIKKLTNINFNKDGALKIGNNGNLLSGGQRQKIALARALYRDASIIILDEVTNSLDQDTKTFLSSDFFKNYLSKKTVIYISHEMSLIENVDKTIVLEKGKILEIRENKLERTA